MFSATVERDIIDYNDSTIISSGGLARRPTQFPRPGARKNGRRRDRGRSQARRTSTGDGGPDFVVEVKRKWHSAKETFLKGLGLYGQVDQMPLGLVVDVWM